MGPPSQLCRRADSLGDVESDRFVARGGEPSGVAGAKAAWVGDMPISSNEFGPGVALLFLLGAPFLTAFSPKKRCPIPIRAGDRLGDLRKAAVDAAVPGVPVVE